MALTFTTIIDKSRRAWKTSGGLEVRMVELTTTSGAADYTVTVGIAMQANANKMGLRRVFEVQLSSWRSSADAIKAGQGVFNPVTGNLLLYESAAAAAFFGEIAASDVAAGDKFRLLVFGV
jgi:hypothetical protein